MPTRLFYTVAELAQHWRRDASEIWQWLIAGDLTAHTWLPLTCVYRIDSYIEGNAIRQRKQLEHWQGQALLTRFQCLRLFQAGQLTLREIMSDDPNTRYVIPDEAGDLIIFADRLIILHQDKAHFEKQYSLSHDANIASSQPKPACSQSARNEPDFKSLLIDGESHHFGDMQAAILKLLHKAALDGEPWQNGKHLLRQVGSESFTLANVFQGKPAWRKIIESNKRGSYRLSKDFVQTLVG